MHQFFQTLEKDHQEVKQILEQMEDTSKGAVKTKEKLFLKLKEELVPHMKGEEKVFYPALQEAKGAREKALEAMEEHHVAEFILGELEKTENRDEKWAAKLKVFKEIIEHHIEEEEKKVWKISQEAFDDKMLDNFMTAFEKEKEKVKQQIK